MSSKLNSFRKSSFFFTFSIVVLLIFSEFQVSSCSSGQVCLAHLHKGFIFIYQGSCQMNFFLFSPTFLLIQIIISKV